MACNCGSFKKVDPVKVKCPNCGNQVRIGYGKIMCPECGAIFNMIDAINKS